MTPLRTACMQSKVFVLLDLPGPYCKPHSPLGTGIMGNGRMTMRPQLLLAMMNDKAVSAKSVVQACP